MKKSLLLLSTVLSLNLTNVFAASASEPFSGTDAAAGVGLDAVSIVVPAGVGPSTTAPAPVTPTASDLESIKSHILGYGRALGLSETIEIVGSSGCCSALFGTTFNSMERYMLNELAGQLMTRLLALALDDIADGKLDGIANGKKIQYAEEVGRLLGIEISEQELSGSVSLETPLIAKIAGFAAELTSMIVSNAHQADSLLDAMGAFAKKKMNKARKSLAVALLQEANRIIRLELGNGRIDGLGPDGLPIDWKSEMQGSIKRSLQLVLDGVLSS